MDELAYLMVVSVRVVERLAEVSSRRVLVLVGPQKGGEVIATQRSVEVTGEVGEKGAAQRAA